MSDIKLGSLFRSAGVYAIASILNSAIPFLLLPVFTRYLSPFDYGIVATFQILIGFVAPFVGMTINGAIAVKYYDKNCTNLPRYISNCIGLLVASTITVSLIFWLGGKQIGELFSFPVDSLWAVIMVSFGQILCQTSLTLWQVQTKPFHYGVFQISQTTVNLTLSIILIVGLGMGWQGRVFAQVFCDGFFGVIALIVLRKDNWFDFKYEKKFFLSAIKFGVPMIPHAIAGWAMGAIDRVLINKMVGVADTGLYTVGYQVSMIIAIVEMSFNNAWVPWLYNNLSNNGDKLRVVRITYLYVTAMILFALMLSFFAPWFMNFLVGKEFHGSIKFVFWLALGKGIYSMYFMTCNYLFYSQRTGLVAISTFSAATVHVIATYFLLRFNGPIGAAQAGIISTVTLVCLTWFFANRVLPMPWSLSKKNKETPLPL